MSNFALQFCLESRFFAPSRRSQGSGFVQARVVSVYLDGYVISKIGAQTKTSSHTNVGTGVLDGPRSNDFCLVMVRRTILLYAMDFLSVTDRRGSEAA